MTNTQSLFPCIPVPEELRFDVTDELFSFHFPLKMEPFIYFMADTMCEDYDDGYWEYYSLINGLFFMAQKSDKLFHVACENGFKGNLSADAFGIVCCLYAYSHLSFGDDDFAQICAEQYHMLKEFALNHTEVGAILAAID